MSVLIHHRIAVCTIVSSMVCSPVVLGSLASAIAALLTYINTIPASFAFDDNLAIVSPCTHPVLYVLRVICLRDWHPFAAVQWRRNQQWQPHLGPVPQRFLVCKEPYGAAVIPPHSTPCLGCRSSTMQGSEHQVPSKPQVLQTPDCAVFQTNTSGMAGTAVRVHCTSQRCVLPAVCSMRSFLCQRQPCVSVQHGARASRQR